MKTKLILIGSAAAAIVAVAALVLPATKPWKQWRAAVLAQRAAALLAAGMAEAAGQAAGRAVQFDPTNVAAHRTLLAVIETLQPADLNRRLMLRSQIADLDAGDRDNLYALAVGALQTERLALARKAMTGLAAVEGASGRVLELQMRAAGAAGNLAAAADTARKLLVLAPENEPAQFMVALANLETAAAAAAPAATAVERFVDSPLYGLEAARALREAAVRAGDFERAKRWAEKAAADPRAGFADQLAAAEAATRLAPDTAGEHCEKLVRAAQGDPASVLRMAVWLDGIGRADLLDDLIARRAALGIDPATAGILRAQRLGAQGRWNDLRAACEPENWGKGEPLRWAYLARACRALGDEDGMHTAWIQAVEGAAATTATARALAGIIRNWPGWEAELEGLLWRARERSPENLGWVLPALHGLYSGQKSAAGLLKVAQVLLEIDPNSERVQNNVAFYSLLAGSGLLTAHRSAAELRAIHPDDPVIASTYALSALLQKQPQEALATMERLPAAARTTGDIAIYYALALAGVGRRDEALAVAAGIARDGLFAEERALLSEAGL